MLVDDLEIQPPVGYAELDNSVSAMGLDANQLRDDIGPRLEREDGQSLRGAMKDFINQKVGEQLEDMRLEIKATEGMRAGNFFNEKAMDWHTMALTQGATAQDAARYLNSGDAMGFLQEYNIPAAVSNPREAELFLNEYKDFLEGLQARVEAGPQLSENDLMANLGYYMPEESDSVYHIDELQALVDDPASMDAELSEMRDELVELGIIQHDVNQNTFDTTHLEAIIQGLKDRNVFSLREQFSDKFGQYFHHDMRNSINELKTQFDSKLGNDALSTHNTAELNVTANQLHSRVVEGLLKNEIESKIKEHLADRSQYAVGQGPRVDYINGDMARGWISDAKDTVADLLENKVDFEALQADVYASTVELKADNQDLYNEKLTEVKQEVLEGRNNIHNLPQRTLSDRAERQLERQFDRDLVEQVIKDYAVQLADKVSADDAIDLNDITINAETETLFAAATQARVDYIESRIESYMDKHVHTSDIGSMNDELNEKAIELINEYANSYAEDGYGVMLTEQAIQPALTAQVEREVAYLCFERVSSLNNGDTLQDIAHNAMISLSVKLDRDADEQFDLIESEHSAAIEQAETILSNILAIQPNYDPNEHDFGFDNLGMDPDEHLLTPEEFLDNRMHELVAEHIFNNGNNIQELQVVEASHVQDILREAQNDYLLQLELIQSTDAPGIEVSNNFDNSYGDTFAQVSADLSYGPGNHDGSFIMGSYNGVVNSFEHMVQSALDGQNIETIDPNRTGAENFQHMMEAALRNPETPFTVDNQTEISNRIDQIIQSMR